jgi:hypothetical protein
MASRADRVATVADAISRYLRARPDAADTVDGIRLWWLTGDAAEETPECVREALELLEAAGIVERRELPGSQVLYAAARRR